jgi:hypothetical protein
MIEWPFFYLLTIIGGIILFVLVRLICSPRSPRRAKRFAYRVGPWNRKESPVPLTVQSTNEEKIRITVVPVTSTGSPAALDGPVRVSVVSGDGSSATIDDLSFFVISSDDPGDTTYLIEADADLGAGIVLVQDTITYTVLGALATSLGLVAGTPEPK